ncbi:hypothetical protein QJS10_CPA09g00205 [Acorus calamus]|uniref:Uncharacterized protein n=1 Tax=Acorus calamus TaxID=4465 RepID=A0AAV9E3I3_ACOCL|nr:hypothetical protein QJS10_CPA09g00205 [Acorus calamus]
MVRARAHGIAHPLEMVETVMEVADVAWEAYEHHHRLRHLRRKVSDDQPSEDAAAGGGEEDYDVASLRSENLRLRSQLEENLSLLESLARSPPLSSACPPDLHVRLAAAVWILQIFLIISGHSSRHKTTISLSRKQQRLTPEELQKTVARALGGMNDWGKMKKVWHAAKLFYAFSTWGIALAGLYRHRAIVKAAAKGVQASGKLIMKAL